MIANKESQFTKDTTAKIHYEAPLPQFIFTVPKLLKDIC